VKPKQPSISEVERELLLEIAAGDLQALPILYGIREIWCLTKYEYPYGSVLRYLKRNKIVGSLFREMFEVKFQKGTVAFAAHLRQEAEKEYKLRAILRNKGA
jgi:hypothetical protein